ncbi:MAG: CDC27 family protein [Paludibacteraceae bacterium]|nr:CDC27 family protein [Paludibacteraceae bacterium]
MSKNIVDIRNLVYKSLRNKSLGRALAQLAVIGNVHLDKIQNLQSTYRTLLNYYMDGAEDPERAEIINYLTKETYELTDEICAGYIPTPYCEYDVFKKLILGIRYDNSTLSFIHEIFTENNEKDCLLACSAITISSLNLFHEEKIEALLEFCKSQHRAVQLRAITGIILSLLYNSERLEYYPQTNNSLNLLFDDEDNVALAQDVVLNILRCTETERISQEISEEIIPNIKKIAPEFDTDKNEDEEKVSPDKKIYEIQDKLEDSGLADKMRTYATLQQEGADINFTTFRQLKAFSFFTCLENWFMPFSKENKDIAELFNTEEGKTSIVEALLSSSTMCDSDKYSLCLNIKSVSVQLRQTLLDNINAENDAMSQAFSDLKDESDSKYINHYLQDIYRFFKLYRDNRYYKDIFAKDLDIHNAGFFRFLNPNNEFLPKLAAFYMSKRLYKESLDAYLKLLASDTSNIQYYKAIGNCHIKLQDYSSACDYYKKADIILSDEESVLKKLALCYRKTGNFKEAEKLYSSLSATDEKNLSYLYNLAICQFEQKDYKQAINNLYKLRFLDEDVKLSPEYNMYLGICLWNEGKKKEAVDALHHYNPLHELEKALKESSYPFSNEEVNFIIDYLRLN